MRQFILQHILVMDGITEPVVLILGHPIAGNPAQFALERAFASLSLEWRVLSCDVPPEKIADAIRGAEVLGFRGLLLDGNVSGGMTDELVQNNCFVRAPDSASGWESENALTTWLEEYISAHFQSLERDVRSLLWIGPPDPRFPTGITGEENQTPIAWASAESIEKANLIAITESIDVTGWPKSENETLVIDLADASNDVQSIRDLGYTVLDHADFRIGILMQCFQRWTGQHPAVETITEAVEEYLAV
ncbi:MAG: hypothetical protein AAF497_28265 [Planctomycetota bacterium]